MILKTPNLPEMELLQEALKVTRKLAARVSELEEAAREKAEKEAAAKAAEEASEQERDILGNYAGGDRG
jgi:hypothetical protein